MENYLIRIAEKLFILYFLGYFIFDFALFLIFLFSLRKKPVSLEEGKIPRVSIIVPAFNEEVSIVNCIRTLLLIDYPNYEVIIVNDGSTDGTLSELLNVFDFQESGITDRAYIKTKEIRSTYINTHSNILLIDKRNGGKADSINAGINAARGELICTIDADSVLDSKSLKRVVSVMTSDEKAFVCGGQIAVANDTIIKNGKVVNAVMPSNPLVLWQITEYIKSFLVSRAGLSKINSLLIMSGAFSVFRKTDLITVGGFLTPLNNSDYIRSTVGHSASTVCEDMEIVVRLWRYNRERKLKGKAVYISGPICWTEVPDNFRNLFKQRARWHLGLAETLSMHSKMIFDPLYGATGLLALPFYLLFELLSPIVKIAAMAFVIYVALAGLINTEWVLMMAAMITLTAALITSIVTVIIEMWSEKQSMENRAALRYKSFRDWLKLLFFSVISDFSFAFFRIAAQLKGLADFARRKSEWNKFERKGVKSSDTIRTSTPAA